MKKFNLLIRDITNHTYEIEANSEDEAIEKFNDNIDNAEHISEDYIEFEVIECNELANIGTEWKVIKCTENEEPKK
jgi:hypothetical protein